MDSTVKKIVVGVIAVLVCGGLFFVYAKVYTTRPIHFKPEDVQLIYVYDLRSDSSAINSSAIIYEKDQIEDVLNILKDLKAYRSISSVDDLNINDTNAIITIASTAKKKKKKSGQTGGPLLEGLGISEEDMPSIYSFYGNNIISYDDEKVFSIKPSEYDKITKICDKYGDNNDFLNTLLDDINDLGDQP